MLSRALKSAAAAIAFTRLRAVEKTKVYVWLVRRLDEPPYIAGVYASPESAEAAQARYTRKLKAEDVSAAMWVEVWVVEP
jgi:hypothetical protein